MSEMEPQAAQEPQDPRPVLWTVGCAFDRRSDMLWENRPCRDVEQVMAVVKGALERGTTEIKIRDFDFARSHPHLAYDEMVSVLPCDVKLPPSTTITKGCSVLTLMTALKMRRGTDAAFPTVGKASLQEGSVSGASEPQPTGER